jgi:hypothetical protein
MPSESLHEFPQTTSQIQTEQFHKNIDTLTTLSKDEHQIIPRGSFYQDDSSQFNCILKISTQKTQVKIKLATLAND